MIFIIFPLFILFNFVNCSNDTSICIDYVPYSTKVNITEEESYTVAKTAWCFKVPPRCIIHETKYRIVTKLRTIPKVREEKKCCPGYRIDSRILEIKCVPECTKCVHGKCVSPEVCECFEGYTGETCDISKASTKCGQCQNNSICDVELGVCKCSPGWDGKECEKPCGKGYFGTNCNQTCLENICDHVTGKNECRDGYMGVQCEHSCPNQMYGKNCSQTCTCKNDALCNHVSGKCHCLPGWTGTYCNIPCPLGKYGADCTQNCLCKNGALCSPIDGECRCTPGWKGKFCTNSNECTYGYYGEHCATPCKCKSETFICDHLKGCICPNNFTGELCDVSIFDKYDSTIDANINLDGNDSTALAISLSVIITILLLIIIAIGFIFYKRKRQIDENNKRYEVRYTANSFNAVDNIYYDSKDNLNNRITNNLRPSTSDFSNYPEKLGTTSSNLQREEPEYCSPLIKNYEADKNNPNINKPENIHSIPEESETEMDYENTRHIQKLKNKSLEILNIK